MTEKLTFKDKLKVATVSGLLLFGGSQLYKKTVDTTKESVSTILDDNINEYNYQEKFKSNNITNEQLNHTYSCINKAYETLSKSDKFKEKYPVNNKIFNDLRLVIKESLGKEDANSSTGAYGYYQLKPAAIKDAKNYIKNELGLELGNLDYKNPEDNCVLGMAYLENVDKLLQYYLEDEIIYDEDFIYLAYNGGARRVAGMITEYHNETNNSTVSWDDFAVWLASKVDGNENYRDNYSKTYEIHFREWLNESYRNNNDKLEIGGVKTSKGKIKEMLDYIEKINQIGNTDKQEAKSDVIQYNEDLDNFKGDGLWDKSMYNFSRFLGKHDDLTMVESVTGKGVISMLIKAKIHPTYENIQAFYKN